MSQQKLISREFVYTIISLGLCFSLFMPIYRAILNEKPATLFIEEQKIIVPSEKELQELEGNYEKISVYRNMADIENEIVQKYEEEMNELTCSKANGKFNEMEEMFFAYQEQIIELQEMITFYQEKYDKSRELVDKMPKFSKVYQKYHDTMERLKVESSDVFQTLQDCRVEELSELYEEAKKFADDWVNEDLDLMSRIGNAEAGNCEAMEIARVLNVIENRKASPDFPNTIRGVIYAPGQYAPVSNGSINKKPPAYVVEVTEEYLRGRIDTGMPDNVFFQSKNKEGEVWLYVPESGHYFCF